MNHSKLKGRIREIFGTQRAFAKAMGMSLCAVNLKLNGKSEWTVPQIRKAAKLLKIESAEIPQYFFCPFS